MLVDNYNAFGQKTQYSDRNGNVHQYGFDIVGRFKTDAVTTLGSGVDGTVRRLETSYDTFLRPYLFTSYDAASGGSIVNQVMREYNGTGQVTYEYQSHSGAVNISTTPKVQYTYNTISSTANYQRLQSIVYPNGRTVTYDYGTTGGLNDRIGRLQGIKDSSTTLEGYTYLGLGQIVRQARANDSELTYIKRSTESAGDAGDQYTGLDRFGRIVDQRWLTTSTGNATDRYFYGYDRDSRRKWKENGLNAALSELYVYDQSGQLIGFQRGTLNANRDAIVGTPSKTEAWSLDATGNWNSITKTINGGTPVVEDRTHDQQNRITTVDSFATTDYDSNGNMLSGFIYAYKYDAWNRLVQMTYPFGNRWEYGYDALNRRITEDHDRNNAPYGWLELNPPKHLYYSTNWQVIEERYDGESSAHLSYVWGLSYIDSMISRDRDSDRNGTIDERLFAQYDANWNTTCLTNTTGVVVERQLYDPFGTNTVLDDSWALTSSGSSIYYWNYLHQGGRYEFVGDKGIYHFRNRSYSPEMGRWLTQDPIGFSAGDTNLYRYVYNSSLNLIDPLGLEPPHVRKLFMIPSGGGLHDLLGSGATDSVLSPWASNQGINGCKDDAISNAIQSGKLKPLGKNDALLATGDMSAAGIYNETSGHYENVAGRATFAGLSAEVWGDGHLNLQLDSIRSRNLTGTAVFLGHNGGARDSGTIFSKPPDLGPFDRANYYGEGSEFRFDQTTAKGKLGGKPMKEQMGNIGRLFLGSCGYQSESKAWEQSVQNIADTMGMETNAWNVKASPDPIYGAIPAPQGYVNGRFYVYPTQPSVITKYPK